MEDETTGPEKLEDNSTQNTWSEHRLQIVLALIGAIGTIAAAVIAGAMAWLPGRSEPPAPPVPTTAAPAVLTVEIEGPEAAALGELTYFTIISEQANRVEWAIAGFGEDVIDPFRQTDQIFVEPGDASRVGEWFTLVVTAFNADGESASARHRFQLTTRED